MAKYKQTNKRVSGAVLEQVNLADSLYSQGKYEQSAEVLKALIQKVDNSYTWDKCEMYRKLGDAYYALNDYDNAIASYDATTKFYDNNASIYNVIGYMYFYKDSDKSIEYYLKGMKLSPDFGNFNMLTQLMIKSKKYNQRDLKVIFEKYVKIFRPKVLGDKKPFSYDPKGFDKNKRLKIGYLSSDFYCHAMMSFVLPILENHNYSKYDVVCYSCGENSDSTTERIKETKARFEDCSKLSNEELAEKIHADGIDILVDLSGYTHKQVWSLIFKPAPVQVQYLGFLGTYGMEEVDYILADEFTIPKEIAKYYTEKPLYIESGMNRFTFNTRNQELPDISISPFIKNGYITFGSFNCTSKINPYTVYVWSKILKAIPTSKLLIYRTQLKQSDITRLRGQFAQNGIEENRLIFESSPVPGSHFNCYTMCDIALDPLPFTGLTITIELLHMGIPVLSLTGETIAAKGASRVLRACGLTDFVATSETELVQKAKNLADDATKLIWYRLNLRFIVQSSDLCSNYIPYVREIEMQYENAWAKFCEGN